MRPISSAHSEDLHDTGATRQIERAATALLPPHTLMQRAGLCTARLALALAPHAQCVWIACGPGNNGGDGFEAALHLHSWGKRVVLTWTGAGPGGLPADAQKSHDRALAAGVLISPQAPADFDLCIDALLGLGARRERGALDGGRIGDWLRIMRSSRALRLSLDTPTELDPDTGNADALSTKAPPAPGARRAVTLSLLTLKPGLFTSQGRDVAGDIWFDDLQVPAAAMQPATAQWHGADRSHLDARAGAAHASHKGSFGDVAILGGESAAAIQMAGAALLAGRAALNAGAGRVFVALLGPAALTVDSSQPELMFRHPDALDLAHQVLVCGCGGGDAVRSVLPRVLSAASRLVLDADALNAIAQDTQLQTLLIARAGRGHVTVLTPHPLEAARLAGTDTAHIQADRLAAAQGLAERYRCVVVLKGSGTVIAAPGCVPVINSSGNALLATAGTGDVLAGMLGASLAAGLGARDAACRAVFAHGAVADRWAKSGRSEALTASRLAADCGSVPAG